MQAVAVGGDTAHDPRRPEPSGVVRGARTAAAAAAAEEPAAAAPAAAAVAGRAAAAAAAGVAAVIARTARAADLDATDTATARVRAGAVVS